MNLKSFIFGKLNWRRILISLVEIYVVLGVFVWLFADKIIHHPPQKSSVSLPGELTLTTSDGIKLSAVFLPNPKAKFTLLLSHGNGEDLDQDYSWIQEWHNSGFQVFEYDYRGYGRSAGKSTERGLYRDIDAAYNYMTQNLKIPPERILVLGRSLGGGPSAYLASTHPVGGLILVSTFTSAFRVPVPFPLYPFDQFQNLKRINQVKCPLLVIHGVRDRLIEVSHGQKLYATYQGPKKALWVEDADHNDIFEVANEAISKAIQEFCTTIPSSL